MGVELEDQGGLGTAMDHWEKRLLGVSLFVCACVWEECHDHAMMHMQNEAMTGQLTFNPVFSRFTFAAFEDSGYVCGCGIWVWPVTSIILQVVQCEL